MIEAAHSTAPGYHAPPRDGGPAVHTPAELGRLLELLTESGARTISIGHGRHPASLSAAQAIAGRWSDAGHTVLAFISYPAQAASWLRAATRIASPNPDAYVIADTAPGFANLAGRLAAQPNWTASRTFYSTGIDGRQLLDLVGPTTLDEMTGVCTAGHSWRILSGLTVQHCDCPSFLR